MVSRADDGNMATFAVIVLIGLLVGFLVVRYGKDSTHTEHGYHRPNWS